MSGPESVSARAAQRRPARVDRLELRDQLAECASEFHALLYIAGYWNPATALYSDPGERNLLSAEEASLVQEMHSILFERWLRTPLADQYRELRAFLATMTRPEQTALLALLGSPSAPIALIPSHATPEQRALFLSDLRAIVSLAQSLAISSDSAFEGRGGSSGRAR